MQAFAPLSSAKNALALGAKELVALVDVGPCPPHPVGDANPQAVIPHASGIA